MMMHEHDQELIMALAEGVLDETAATAARAEIEACPECSADLQLQLVALAAIAEAPEVFLTATESSRLHAALKQELSLAAPAPARPKRSFAWGRFLPIAGMAAAFLVVIVALPTLFGGGSDDSADETIAAPAMDAEAPEAALMETTEAAPTEMRDSVTDLAGGMAAEESPATTAAAATTTTAPALLEDNLGLIFDVLDYLGPLEELDTEALLARIQNEDLDLIANSDAAKSADPLFAGCLEESVTPEIASIWGIPVDSEPLILGLVTNAEGENLVLVAYVPENAAETVFTAQRFGCSLIVVLP